MLFSGLREEHTSWATIVQNASQKDIKPLEFSTITTQLLDKARILLKSLSGTDSFIALFDKSKKQKFSLGISSNANLLTKRFMP